MSARPWMPLYVAEYMADTAHLGALESGAYLHLIFYYWQTGGLPAENKQLARIAKVSARQWTKLVSVLKPFFQDGWRHNRVDAELARASEISGKRRDAVNARRDRQATNEPTNVEQEKTHLHLQLPSKKETISRATRSDDGFEEFWKVYPKRASASPKKPANLKYAAAIKRGVSSETILAGARAYLAECDRLEKTGTQYVKTPEVWIGQEGWTAFTDRPSTGPPAGLTFEQRAAWAREQMAKERAENVEGRPDEQGRDLLERRPGLRAINH